MIFNQPSQHGTAQQMAMELLGRDIYSHTFLFVDTGACGFGNVGNPPYNSMIAAGNQALYQSGKGCGSCYLVKCTDNPACSGQPIKIHITDECPGACNNEPVWFDLGGLAFGYMGKPGQADVMRNYGRVKIWYQRYIFNLVCVLSDFFN
ncbi:hypothetical protein DM860_011081 [Cuscuta australis]|uniref:Expansin-like EG45 domain-containing protein n=1 Tax=Cuscuta australis TaxID=267555 RepID=A0A328E4R3_9ASTE|nr:hypothetical protein DM860_011081 [Cuscuta australis]